MERIGFLINKLKEQYEKAGSQDSMLVTLQMLYKELMPKMEGSPMVGGVSVIIPGLMDLSFLDKNIGQKGSVDVASNRNDKQVFDLPAEPTEEIQLIEKKLVIEEKPPVLESKQIAPQPPKNPFVVLSPKVEVQVPKPDLSIIEKPIDVAVIPPKIEPLNGVNERFMPPELKPAIENGTEPTPVSPVAPPWPFPQPVTKTTANVTPPKEVHESINVEAKPTLNDKVENLQPELFHLLKAEPLKDLKKAISINERFQYINHLFMKDESMYERSLKTINSFNVISEAKFWIRKELAIKMGWNDKDEVVKQFMGLVERRFS